MKQKLNAPGSQPVTRLDIRLGAKLNQNMEPLLFAAPKLLDEIGADAFGRLDRPRLQPNGFGLRPGLRAGRDKTNARQTSRIRDISIPLLRNATCGGHNGAR